MSKEKLYINRIPVYREEITYKDSNEIEYIKYTLYEDDDIAGTVFTIKKQDSFIDEYKIILNSIAEDCGMNNNYKYGISIRYMFNNIKIHNKSNE